MSWYDDLSGAEHALIEPRFLKRTFARGETIVLQGDGTASVCLLDAGHVAVKVSTPGGGTVTATVLGPQSSFGEIAAITRHGRTATVIALTDVTVRVLPGPAFDDLRRREPKIDRALLRAIAERLDDLSMRLAEVSYETVQQRSEHRLLALAASFAAPDAGSASIPLTLEDLAAVVGAARPAVDEVLSGLVDKGLVSLTPGTIEVPDVGALRASSGLTAAGERSARATGLG